MGGHCFLNQRYRYARATLEDCVARMGELLTRATELLSLEAQNEESEHARQG